MLAALDPPSEQERKVVVSTASENTGLTARSVVDLWADYAVARSEPTRNALVLHYLPLVRRVTDRMLGGLPARVDAQDLYAEGHLGLIEAVERFEPGRDIRFETFAQWRIKGAVQDYLRRQDWLSRTARDRLKVVQRAIVALEQQLRRTPSDDEVAAHLDRSGQPPGQRDGRHWTAAQVREVLGHYTTSHIASLDDLAPRPGGDTSYGEVADAGAAPEEETTGRLQQGEARAAIGELGERERQLVALYFYEELTLADIGRVLGVSESRVSQILKKVLITLAGKLDAAGAAR